MSVSQTIDAVVDGKLALREREAAEALGVSAKTLRNWRSACPAKGPRFARVDRSIFYPVNELQNWLADHVVE